MRVLSVAPPCCERATKPSANLSHRSKDTTLLRFRALGPAAVELTGLTGLDRTLRACVGTGGVRLAAIITGADGLTLNFEGPACRLERTPATTIRVGGRLVGIGCDLLHGDVIEVVATGLRLEVP